MVKAKAILLISAQRLAVAPAKWKLEFKKDVIAGCHERLVRLDLSQRV